MPGLKLCKSRTDLCSECQEPEAIDHNILVCKKLDISHLKFRKSAEKKCNTRFRISCLFEIFISKYIICLWLSIIERSCKYYK